MARGMRIAIPQNSNACPSSRGSARRPQPRRRTRADVSGRKEVGEGGSPTSISTYNNIPKHVNTLEWHRAALL